MRSGIATRRLTSKSTRRDFVADFEALDAALSNKVVLPVERLIVELGLTPRAVARLRRQNVLPLGWFRPAYSAMHRHGLEPRSRSWEAWLRRYQTKRRRYA